MRDGSQEREWPAKCMKTCMEKRVLSLTLKHRTKVSSFCRLYGSVDLMAIDQMGYRF